MRWVAICLEAFLFAPFAIAGEPDARATIITENVPDTPPALREKLRSYQNVRSAQLGGWPADGNGLFVLTGSGETPQAHFVEAPNGDRRQLTFSNEPVDDFAPSPVDPNVFAFTRDVGGNENYQVYLGSRQGGDTIMISDGMGRKGSLLWSPDGSRLAWRTTLEGAERGIVLYDLDKPGARKIVFAREGWWSPIAWSPGGDSLVLYHYVSVNESSIYLLNLATGAQTQINPGAAKIAYGDVEFSHDGKSIYYTSNEAGEFLHLYRYDFYSNRKKNLTGSLKWNVEDIEVSPTGRGYAFVTNEGGRSRLHFRTRFGHPFSAPRLPKGIVTNMAFSPDGRWLAFTYDGAAAPSDVFTVRFSARIKTLDRWAQSGMGGLNPEKFIEPEFFDFPTFDKSGRSVRDIPAFIYRPLGRGPHPVVISIHGGPEGQARPTFSAQYQFWTQELGLAVIRPNVRGSTGYGKTYQDLDNGKQREDAVKDIGALLNWIDAQPDLDKDRIIVYGGSYGGYMSLASMVFFNEKFAGGVDLFGISNFVTFLENTASYRRDLRRAEYGDERDPDMRAFLQRISPLRRAGEISKPMLIIQGLNDPRVPASESDQLYRGVQENGGEPWYLVATDEGHGFKKRGNRDALSEIVAMFFIDVLGLDLLPENDAATK